MKEIEKLHEQVNFMSECIKYGDIGDTPSYDKGELEKRICLLDEVVFSLEKYMLNKLKGERRYENALELFQLIFHYRTGSVEGAEDFLKREIRKAKEIFQGLPQDILDGVSDIADLFFGDFSSETRKKLKSFLYRERNALRPTIEAIAKKWKRAD